VSNSHSASSQLSGEFMLLHSIHTLANFTLKETVSPQPRTSPHVTVEHIYSIQWNQVTLCFSGQAQVAQKSWLQKLCSIQWKFSGQTLFFRV